MELFNAGNIAYVNEDYETAHELFSRAIDKLDTSPDFFSCRASASLKLKNYLKALEDCNKALSLDVIFLPTIFF